MYSANGTTYNEEHSISFGKVVSKTIDGASRYVFQESDNTWTSWHLIPASRPSIAHPEAITKFIEIPGANGALDLSTYLTGGINYKMRVGSISFYIDNHHEFYETIREKMVSALHGKTIQMVLQDDPTYVYEGRFTVGTLEAGASYSSISINYQLEPFKVKIDYYGYGETVWDTFNFETDYDYSFLSRLQATTTPTDYYIYAGAYSFKPIAEYISGNPIKVVFNTSEPVEVSSEKASKRITLSASQQGKNTVTIYTTSGTGTIRVLFRGGSL